MKSAEERYMEVLELARELGLDFFDLKFEVIPFEVMTEIAAYGLPIRAHHWSYGKVYNRLRIHGRMGLSKIYEIVLNNDPSYAFLLDTNREIENILIVAHVAAHSDFFKNNVCFAGTNRNMVNEAAEHAARIDQYKERYGLERVERLMDAAFALDKHIEPSRGLNRRPYPQRQVVEKERKADEYEDLFPGEGGFSIRRETVGEKIPPRPEGDILWFLSHYARLEPWERDVLDIVREESYYFYPQFMTKIINEGWASYWHAEVIKEYGGITPQEMLEFSALHSSVVNRGGRFHINPYYLGYKILADVEKRWDRLHKEGASPIDGRAKLFQIRTEEDDVSLIRNYLTAELAEELELFTYDYACDCHKGRPVGGQQPTCPKCGYVAVKSRDLEAIKEQLLRPRYNYGVPKVVITDVVKDTLFMEQQDVENGGLDREYAEKTMEYISELWKGPVRLTTVDGEGRPIEMVYDRGFKVYRKD